MTINCFENNAEVMQPGGHRGRVQVTRRLRQLISDGKMDTVRVLGSDGVNRVHLISDLGFIEDEAKHEVEPEFRIVIKPDEVKQIRGDTGCSMFEAKDKVLKLKLLEALDGIDNAEVLKEILNQLIRKSFSL